MSNEPNFVWPRMEEEAAEKVRNSTPNPRKKLYIILSAIAALVAVFLSIFSVSAWQRSVESEGRTYQINMTNLYGKVLGDLSTCMNNTAIAANIAKEERQSLMELLAKAVGSRYTSPDGKSVNASDPQGQAYIMRMMQEAYPNVSDALFRQLMAEALGCNKDVRDVQNQLREMIKEFRIWRTKGDPIAGAIRESFPTRELKVESFRGTLYGAEAEEFMDTPLMTEGAEEGGKNRRLPTEKPFPSPTKK